LEAGASELVAAGLALPAAESQPAAETTRVTSRTQLRVLILGLLIAQRVPAFLRIGGKEERPGPSLAGAYRGVAVLEPESKLPISVVEQWILDCGRRLGHNFFAQQ
jgi:hypothetical protein